MEEQPTQLATSDSSQASNTSIEASNTHGLQDSSTQTSDNAKTETNWKGDPSTYCYKGHQMCYSSRYTRPAMSMLKEILEVRYPSPTDR